MVKRGIVGTRDWEDMEGGWLKRVAIDIIKNLLFIHFLKGKTFFSPLSGNREKKPFDCFDCLPCFMKKVFSASLVDPDPVLSFIF